MNQLGVTITTASGAVFRWGGDEPDARNAPQSVNFSSSIPGGFSAAQITLEREIDRDWPDLNLYDDVRIYGPGNQTAWEGRVAELPRSDGDQESITVGCVGWAAHLRDDPTFTEIYVDRDLERWHEPPFDRRYRIVVTLNVGYGGFDASVRARSIRFDSKQNSQIDQNDRVEVWYTMPPGRAAARVTYRGVERSTGSIVGAAVDATDDDDGDPTTAYSHTLDDTIRTDAISPATRYLNIRAQASANVNKNAANQFSRTYKLLAVYGDHGLTLHDPEDATDANGVLASDVIEDVVSRAAPLLSTDIEATSFVIPHLIFPDPTTAEDVIAAANAFDLYEWGVYEDRTFFYRAPDPDRLTWIARRSDGADLDLEGSAGDQVYNGVVVSYTNTIGEEKTVGPVGSDSDDETNTLLDDSETNPVNAHGIPRRYYQLDLSAIHSLSGAKRMGARWLEEQSQPQRRGTLTVTGQVEHPTKGLQPVWAVRAGDFVKVGDHSGDVARRVIEVRYDHDSRTATLTLDNSAARVEAILERGAAVLAGPPGKGKSGVIPRYARYKRG